MSLNELYFNKAYALLEQRRSLNRTTELMRRNEVCKKIPEYAQLEELLADTSKKLISLVINNHGEIEEQLEQLEKSSLAIQENMKQLLKLGGFSEDYLDRIYTCPECKDKGTVNGKWCGCFQKLMLGAAAEELNAVSPLRLCDFDNFRLDVYSDAVDNSLGTSPRAIMKHNLDFCKQYAAEFSNNSDGIIMNGGTGLGKTHLSLAIADAVIKRGFSVTYGSVPELLRTIEREYYGKSDEDTMHTLSLCDLLILDDLGAEMEKPLYTSLLYELINSRISRGLPMIINSNLSAQELQQRYQDRILSRLYSMEVLAFYGSDVRIKLKSAAKK
ncbi:MAG: ATP-binding protein [Oscillospiraceae bacterium]